MKQVLISGLPAHQQKQVKQKSIQNVIDSFRECLAGDDPDWSIVMRTGRELQVRGFGSTFVKLIECIESH